MVVHNVLLDGCTTQKRIEKATLLPRSAISEVLAQSVKRGIIKVTKKEGSRTKLYQPTISFAELMLGNVDRLAEYESTMMIRISEFISMTKKTRSESGETKRFLDFLNILLKAYSFAQRLTKELKVKLVLKLKEEYDRGFDFI